MGLGRATTSTLIAAIALAIGGCSEQERPGPDAPAPDPPAAVEDAGRSTFSENALAVRLRASSPGGGYVVAGLIEPGSGRSRVERESSDRGLEIPPIVIGLDGEGFEKTVSVSREGFGHGQPGPCWFNPHAPVGTSYPPKTISVEEATRLLGSILESLDRETASAKVAPGDVDRGPPYAYEVRLTKSASMPRDDFHETKRRVWGDRGLLAQLAGPITVEVGDAGTVEGIALELSDYEPYAFSRSKPKIESVSIRAELSPSDDDLEIKEPSCQAIE